MKSEFYRMHFRDWDISTVDLSLEQEGAHLRFCHAMYNAHGPIPDSTRLLCSIWRCGNVKAAALRKALIEAGKIQIDADGSLTNKRVMAELTDRAQISAKRSAAGEQGGRAVRRSNDHEGGEGRVKVECPRSDVGVDGECSPSDAGVGACNPLENNDLSRANASALEGREEKRREDPPKPPRGGRARSLRRVQGRLSQTQHRVPHTAGAEALGGGYQARRESRNDHRRGQGVCRRAIEDPQGGFGLCEDGRQLALPGTLVGLYA